MCTITALRRRYLVTLGGWCEITTTERETRRFPSGSLVLLDGMPTGATTLRHATAEGTSEETGPDPPLSHEGKWPSLDGAVWQAEVDSLNPLRRYPEPIRQLHARSLVQRL